MERLTNGIDYCHIGCDFGKGGECFFEDKSKCYEKNVHDKLRKYEQAEEDGLLIRLPCKVGDTVYSVVEDGFTIFPLKFSLSFYVRRKGDFGKTIFLTKEEAEQALEKMKEKKHEWNFRRYVDLYARDNKISVEEALEHKLVKETEDYYRERRIART